MLTVAQSGLPGYSSESTLGLFGPASTPTTIVERLNKETITVLSVAETRDKLLKSGIEVATSSPAGFAALIKSDMVQSGAIIRAAGIRSD